MASAVRDGVVVTVMVVGMQVVYRLYPGYFVLALLALLMLLVFYRKLDRIEAALSEERRRQNYRRRRALGRWVMMFVGVAGVLTGIGSYAVWKWLPPLN